MRLDGFLDNVSDRSEAVRNNQFISLRLEYGRYHGRPSHRFLRTCLKTRSLESFTNRVLAIGRDILLKYLSSNVTNISPGHLTIVDIDAADLGTQD